MKLLKGKRGIITGVMNDRSIAYDTCKNPFYEWYRTFIYYTLEKELGC
ncbi:hypothetical protein [Wolbachia endosymbiont of Pentidionis agamae]